MRQPTLPELQSVSQPQVLTIFRVSEKSPSPCSNEQYEAAMATVMARAVGEGIEVMAFGDLFLEDIRAYRVGKLAGTGVEPVFPVWQIPTDELAHSMLDAGVDAAPDHFHQPLLVWLVKMSKSAG